MASNKKLGRLNYDWTEADAWMRKNPTQPYPVFLKKFPNYPFTDATYYGRRRKVTGKGRAYTPSSRKTLYETLGTFEMAEVQKMNAISAMKALLALIDKNSKTHVEIVQLANPNILEVRKFTR